MITINTINIFKKLKRFNTLINKKWRKVFYVYKNKMVARAKNIHVYKNRTGNLTNNSSGFVRNLTINLYNNTKYAKYVQGYTDNNWLKSAATYYRRDLERDLRRK